MMRRARELYAAPRWRELAMVTGVALTIAALLAFSRPIVMLVDGERVESDVAPVTTANDRAYVPLRSISDALGAETQADARGNVTVVLGGHSLRVRVGDTHASVDGMPLTLRHAPFRIRGRVMISLDAISRALRVQTTYDPRQARIEVRTPGIGQAPSPGGAAAQ